MKSLLRIIRRYVFAAFFVIVLILFLDIAAYAAMFFGFTDSGYGNRNNLIAIAGELTAADGQLVLSPEGEELLDSQYIWGMLLDLNGNAIWTWNLPEEIPTAYTVPEVASFSRWYLKDYPVYVWQHDQGLLVLLTFCQAFCFNQCVHKIKPPYLSSATPLPAPLVLEGFTAAYRVCKSFRGLSGPLLIEFCDSFSFLHSSADALRAGYASLTFSLISKE